MVDLYIKPVLNTTTIAKVPSISLIMTYPNFIQRYVPFVSVPLKLTTANHLIRDNPTQLYKVFKGHLVKQVKLEYVFKFDDGSVVHQTYDFGSFTFEDYYHLTVSKSLIDIDYKALVAQHDWATMSKEYAKAAIMSPQVYVHEHVLNWTAYSFIILGEYGSEVPIIKLMKHDEMVDWHADVDASLKTYLQTIQSEIEFKGGEYMFGTMVFPLMTVKGVKTGGELSYQPYSYGEDVQIWNGMHTFEGVPFEVKSVHPFDTNEAKKHYTTLKSIVLNASRTADYDVIDISGNKIDSWLMLGLNSNTVVHTKYQIIQKMFEPAASSHTNPYL